MKDEVRRTDKEIEAEITKGEAWIKKWPTTAFGDDNVESHNLFLKVIEVFRKNPTFSYDRLQDLFYDLYTERQAMTASGYLDWLFGYEPEVYPEC